MNRIIHLFFAAIIITFFSSCDCSLVGAENLGKNLALLEGDVREDKVIVYCGNKENCCSGGAYILPTYENHYDKKGNYAEFIEEVAYNERWILVKSFLVKENKFNYWIIDKNFDLKDSSFTEGKKIEMIRKNVIGPLNKKKLDDLIKNNKIKLSL